MTTSNNLILIGMPSCGKSTLGVLLAKRLAMCFMDTDIVIQEAVGMRLQAYQREQGMAGFRALEARILSSVQCAHTVIATGGSAVYYPEAIAHLKTLGRVVFLDVPLEAIRLRIGDFAERGVVLEPGMSLQALFATRRPLYLQHADSVITCGDKALHELVEEVAQLMAGVHPTKSSQKSEDRDHH